MFGKLGQYKKDNMGSWRCLTQQGNIVWARILGLQSEFVH